MSEVISFRLNKNNPRERRALEILDTWYTEGFSTRHVITGALLQLNCTGFEHTDNTLDELKSIMYQVNQVLEQLSNNKSSQLNNREYEQDCAEFTDSFIISIKKSAKKGLRLK